MKITVRIDGLLTAALGLTLLVSSSVAAPPQRVLEDLRSRPGLIVHLGTTDGTVEAQLARGGERLVHGLALTTAERDRARKALQEEGLYGLASVEELPRFEQLPHADRLVNAVVADLDVLEARGLTEAEIRRVLAPFGTAWIKRNGRWHSLTKPVPSEFDEWQHWDHGADGNPFSRDKGIGPTTSLRWLAGATSVDRGGSKVGLRIADGTVYYAALNYDPEARYRKIRRNDLFARDAFNGILRWKHPLDGVAGGGDTPMRFSLTARDQHVYCYPREGGPLQALDARTGEVRVSFREGPTQPPVKGWDKWKDPVRKINFAVRVFDGKILQTFGTTAYLSDARSGDLIWKRSIEGATAIGWAVAGGGKVYLAVAERDLIKNRASHATPADRIVALDAANGEQVWNYRGQNGRMMFRMIYYRDSICTATFGIEGAKPNFGKNPIVVRLDARDGTEVWKSNPKGSTRGHYSVVMARGDEVFVGQQSGFGVSFTTGALTRHYNWGQADNSCADLKCVPGYTLYGLTFIDREGTRLTRGQTRTICDVGLFPAYGMLYGSPLGCLCSEYLNGYSALTAEPEEQPIANPQRLVPGPAFEKVGPVDTGRKPSEWPLHLADSRRSSWSPSGVTIGPSGRWRQLLGDRPEGLLAVDWRDNEKITGALTAPTAAAGKIFVARPDSHELVALDARTGRKAWAFTAGGRIDSPPTVLSAEEDALCLFGSRDGWVYCLRASDGALVWKFLAARNHKRICTQSQLESPWPVHGSLVVDGDGVIVMAGRQSALDSGIHVYKLAPVNGRILWTTRLWTDPDLTRGATEKQKVWGPTRNRRIADLLVHNGKQACLWITPLARSYEPGELVDIDSRVYQARALKFSVPSKDELRDISGATWIWSASSAGFLSRRLDSVGRHDGKGLNYAALNAQKLCLTDDGSTLYALESSVPKEKAGLRGALVRIALNADGTLPDEAEWSTKIPNNRFTDAMLVAGDKIYVTQDGAGDQPTRLQVFSTAEGSLLDTHPLPARPVRDGVIAAFGRLYVACQDGSVVCLGND